MGLCLTTLPPTFKLYMKRLGQAAGRARAPPVDTRQLSGGLQVIQAAPVHCSMAASCSPEIMPAPLAVTLGVGA